MFTRKELKLPNWPSKDDIPASITALKDQWRELQRFLRGLNDKGVLFPSHDITPGVSFGGGTTGITYTSRGGSAVIMGSWCIATGSLVLSSKGSSTGAALITGLNPAIKNSTTLASGSVSVALNKVTFANQYQATLVVNSTTIFLGEVTEAGAATALTDADFANDSSITFTATYRI